MTRESLENLQAKGFVQQPDGSWSKEKITSSDKGIKILPANCASGSVFLLPSKFANVAAAVLQKKRPANGGIVKDTDGLNKTERAFWEVLKLRSLEFDWMAIQPMGLKIGHDCRYHPDFMTHDVFGKVVAWEVKGFFRDDAKVKLAVAARAFPWITFVLVKRDGSGWAETIVRK